MSAQWPTEEHLRFAWIEEGFHRIDNLGKTRNQVAQQAAAEFNTWLTRVRAEAWEEGREAGRSDTHDHPAPNPYQQEESRT